jgi:WD40 repeat protein
MVKIDNIKDIDMRNALMRLVEVGMTPMQILDVDSKPKIDKKEFLLKNENYSLSKGNTLDESTKLISVNIESQRYNLFSTKYYENNKNSYNKNIHQIVEPAITKLICKNTKILKIFLNYNYYYTINLQNYENKGIIEESNISKIENYSSKYASTYQIIENKLPFIIYNNDKYILKAGFWDNRLEINSIPTAPKEEPIINNIYLLYGGPISTMQMSDDEKFLLCGTKLGYVICFSVNEYIIETKCNLNVHNDEITSISINDNLNMFATASMDGYIMIYILPSFVLVGSIQISKKISENDISDDEFLFANNIFLSSSPLACLVCFISSKRLFRIFSINGGYIGEVGESEDTTKLNDAIIFKNLDFQEFLIYGTDDGYVKIRNFPDMNLINMIKPFEGQEIKTLGISPDKRYCLAWSHSNKIVIIKDTTVTRVDIKESNKDKGVDNEQNEDEMD